MNLFPREVPRVLNLFPRELIEGTRNFKRISEGKPEDVSEVKGLAEDATEGLPEENPSVNSLGNKFRAQGTTPHYTRGFLTILTKSLQ